MDKTTKFILGLIAVSLIGINVQMWNGKLIKDAHAINKPVISYNVCYKGGAFGDSPKRITPENWWGFCN